VVVATLALGIGATTAVFSVLQAVLMAPLPFEEPGQLVRLYQQEPDTPATREYLTGAHFSFLREHATSFEALAALNNYSEKGLDRAGRKALANEGANWERLSAAISSIVRAIS
jgi:hypothetical protein